MNHDPPNASTNIFEERTPEGAVRISIRRFRWTHIVQVLFGTVGGAFMVFLTLMLWRSENSVDPLAWPVVGAFDLVMFGLIYTGLAGICNTLVIEIDRWQVRLWQRPLPHWQRFAASLDELRYLRRLTVRHQNSSSSGLGNSRVHYTERLVLVDARNAQYLIMDDLAEKRVRALSELLSERLEIPLIQSGEDLPPHLRSSPGDKSKPIAKLNPSESPTDVHVRNTARGQELGLRWFRPIQIAILIGCIFMMMPVGFAWLMTLAFINESAIMPLFLIIPLVFTIIVGAIGYGQIASFFNYTWLYVAEGALHRAHQPLPWPGQLAIPVSEIEAISPQYESMADAQNASSHHCYSLICKKRDGSQVSLCRRLTAETAQHLAHSLMRHLDDKNGALAAPRVG